MQREHDLSFVDGDVIQGSEPPSIGEINTELDIIKELARIPPRDDHRTGISYIEKFASTRQLEGISTETQDVLGVNGRNGEVKITFAYDNMGIARRISIQRRAKVASFVIAANSASPASPLQEVRKQEAPLSIADALLIAKLGRRLLTKS